MKFKTLITGIAAAAMGTLMAASASALPFSVVQGPDTSFEDDSGEFVLREQPDGSFAPVTSGAIEVGDVFAAVLDLTDIGGQSLEALGTEVTGILLTRVETITPTGTVTRGGVEFDRGDFSFSAAYDLFDEIFGLPEQAAGTVALLWEDLANNLNLLGNASQAPTSIPDAISKAIDGTLLARFAMDDMSSFDSFEVPLEIDTFGASFTTTNQQLGTFQFSELLVTDWFGPGALLSNRTSGSGNLFAPSANNPFPVEDDFQFSMDIPVPATLGLFGFGLVGLGLLGRRRRMLAA